MIDLILDRLTVEPSLRKPLNRHICYSQTPSNMCECHGTSCHSRDSTFTTRWLCVLSIGKQYAAFHCNDDFAILVK